MIFDQFKTANYGVRWFSRKESRELIKEETAQVKSKFPSKLQSIFQRLETGIYHIEKVAEQIAL